MQFIKNLKLSRMITLVSLVPIAALTMFSAQSVYQEIQKSRAVSQLGKLTELAVKMSNLVHEQQKERAATAGFLSSNGTKFAEELPAQRLETDQKRTELDAFLKTFDATAYGAKFSEDLEALLATMAENKTCANRSMRSRYVSPKPLTTIRVPTLKSWT